MNLPGLDRYERLFVYAAFSIQIILLLYFALRKWRFDTAMRYGWIVYALAGPAVVVSIALFLAGEPWQLWLGGFLFAGWAILGFIVDIARPITWRSPIHWPVFAPYVLLYLVSQMFYWFPLGTIQRPLWFFYGGLFVISTLLNITSHA